MNTLEAIKIGNTVNCFVNGKLYKKSFTNTSDADDFYKIILNKKEGKITDDDLKDILSFLNDNLRIALKCGLETDPDTGLVYSKGFNTPIPETLIKTFEEYYEKKFPLTALENFWSLLMINEDKRIRDEAFDFIKKHDFVVATKGFMVTYKAVVKVEAETNQKFVDFVNDTFIKIKKKWKKNPKKYVVYLSGNDEEYHVTKKETVPNLIKSNKNRMLGNLDYLYNNIDEYKSKKNMYTDMYSKTMKIELGKPVYMDRNQCDANPKKECSYGLHVGATKYVEHFAGTGENVAVLVCLVNPAHIVAVPNYNHSKMRVSEYFPIAEANYNKATKKIDIIKQPYFEHDYTTYEEDMLNKLLDNVRSKEQPRPIPKNGVKETRSLKELEKIIEKRLFYIS
jgi:hypothetical protein